MSSVHRDVQLVEWDGTPLAEEPGPESWPLSIENDCITYEISDPAERDAIFSAWLETECDRHDAPDRTEADRRDFEAWLASLERDYPPPSQISDDELAQLAAHGTV